MNQRVMQGGAEPRPIPLEPVELRQVIDAVASPLRLITLAALDQTPHLYVSKAKLAQRINALQGVDPGWHFSRDYPAIPFKHSKTSLRMLGTVVLGQAEGTNGRTVEGVQITPLGSEVWPAVAGAYLPWLEAQDDISLKDLHGSSAHTLRHGESSRLRVLTHILDSGGASYPTRAHEALGIGRISLARMMDELVEIGLLSRESVIRAEERSFRITNDTDQVLKNYGRMGVEMRAVIDTMACLRETQQIDHIDGSSMMAAVARTHPDLDIRKAWITFCKWMRNHSNRSSHSQKFIIPEGSFDSGLQQQELRINPVYEEAIQEFLEIRERLLDDVAFQMSARDIGRTILKSKKRTSNLLRRSKNEETNTVINPQQWELLLFEHIPSEGISAVELHKRMRSAGAVNVRFQSFMDRLLQIDQLVSLSSGRESNGITAATIVNLRKHEAPQDWQRNGRCSSPDVDPNIFSPYDTLGEKARRRQEIQAISECGSCVVRAACRADVLQSAEDDYNIRGGLTPKQRQGLTTRQREQIINTVTIAS